MEFFGKAAELLESLDKANKTKEEEKLAGSVTSTPKENIRGINTSTTTSTSSSASNNNGNTLLNTSSTRNNTSSNNSFTISPEEQISQGYHRETALRAEVAALRQRLGEVDFDAVHRVRTECDVLSQRLAALSRDYESLRSSSEGQAHSSQLQIIALTRENEALELRISQQASSARSREDALLEDVAMLSTELQTRPASSRIESTNNLDNTNNSGFSRTETAAVQKTAIDDAISLASKPLLAQLSLERARVAELEINERALQASIRRDRVAEAEARQLMETQAIETRELSSRNTILEMELVKLRASQLSVTALQRLASESAKESAAANAQLSELRSRSKAATSLLAQEQLSHQATRVAYEELQRLFASSTKSRTTSSGSSRGDRLPTRAGSLSSTEASGQQPFAILDKVIVSGLAMLASNKRARSVFLVYFAFLQLWALFLIFSQHMTLPHSLHTEATRLKP
jgi:hypothetical protein